MINEDGEIIVPILRTRYNYDMDEASARSGLECKDATLAQQQFKEECDINTIVERFGITGMLPTNLRVPLAAEFVDVLDYHTAMNTIIASDKAFMEMPANIRDQFQNNAGRFVDFVSDPANVEQCRKWGLALELAPGSVVVPPVAEGGTP